MRFGVSRIEGGSPGSRAIKDSRGSSTSRELARTKGTVDYFQYSDFSAKIPKIGIFITEIAIGRWEFISKAPGGLGGIRAANTGTPCELGIRFRDGGFVDFGRGRISVKVDFPKYQLIGRVRRRCAYSNSPPHCQGPEPLPVALPHIRHSQYKMSHIVRFCAGHEHQDAKHANGGGPTREHC